MASRLEEIRRDKVQADLVKAIQANTKAIENHNKSPLSGKITELLYMGNQILEELKRINEAPKDVVINYEVYEGTPKNVE